MASFQNIYYKRTAATAKACYMCFRPTTTVLATLNTTDFLYTCDGHLTDQGFATVIEPSPKVEDIEPKKVVSDKEIRRVKEEWEERQRLKQERAKGDDKLEEVGKESEAKKPSMTSSSKPSPSPPASIPVPGSNVAMKPTHQRYTLHRDVWAMRLAEHKKKRQNKVVKEIAPKLPMTPRGHVA
ncbi:DUF1742-domain-containing protein [Ramaria rubella]|nr:DUF1742-domain-containing protein [Ramaria rubella]